MATDGARDTRSCSSTGNPGDQPLSASVRPTMRLSMTGYGNVAAGARDVAGVAGRVARPEQGHVGADGFDHARGAAARHLRLRFQHQFGRAHLRIDRVD